MANTREQVTLKMMEAILPRINHAMSRRGGLKGDGQLDLREVEKAIGYLLVGQVFGWRVLELMHGRNTSRKYCDLLGIGSIRDFCPELGPYSNRHYLFQAMRGISDWYRDRYSPALANVDPAMAGGNDGS